MIEIVPNTDKRPSDMKLSRCRVQLTDRRFLFGERVNEHGFLAESGRVLAVEDTGGDLVLMRRSHR